MGSNAFGQSLTRKEDFRFITGHGAFTADAVLPGQVHAVMLRSPHAHARIIAIDTAAARAMPGVLAVLTGADFWAAGLGGVPSGEPVMARFVGTDPAQTYAFRPPPRAALAHERVRMVGDTVAMVVAEGLSEARDAAEAVMVEYETLPCVTETENAIGGAAVWDEAPDNICFRWSAGDKAAVDRAFAAAARVVRLRVVNNRIVVGALETRGAVGVFEAGRYVLHTGSQMPHKLKAALAEEVFHVQPDQVRVLIRDVGGSFGIKNALYPEQVLVLWAARLLGRPVGWIGERSDGFAADYQARDNFSIGELALSEDGDFLGLRVTSIAALGAYLAPEGQLSPTANTPALAGVYRLPCIHVSVTGVFTHTAPTDVYRGAGRPEAIFLLERLVDHAARDSKIDRLALRRRNLVTPDDLPYRTGLGLVYDSGDFPRILALALQRADADGFPARRAAAQAAGKWRGLGVAQYCERVAGGWAENAWAELDGHGRVTVLVGTMSNGQGHETAYAQLVAGQLGIDPNDVVVVQGDTDRIASGHGTGGSASLSIGGAALSVAADELVRRALPIAADALEAAEADVEFADGAFRIAGTDRSMTIQAVGRLLGAETLRAEGYWQPRSPTFPNGCHIAEVEIDPETGTTSLAAYTMVHDFGRVLNPLLLEGQMQGGVVQGIGQALQERVVYERESGQLVSGSMMDYQMPRASDLPALELVTQATPAPSHPLGIKGAGEAGATGAPPAVMNAIIDALDGAEIDMPANAEVVWRTIRGRGNMECA
jgi:carbon-monoxide dehydrogenase large subunit